MPPLVEPLAQLAIALEDHPGTYALLLGSGISRAAGIPTGWEILLNLIGRVAAAENVDPTPDLVAWWTATRPRPPNYSEILQALAPMPEARRALIAGFVEPNEHERAEGRKQPTEAHRAIARLVAAGTVKVIVTTNFDRLLEMAFADAGVEVTVVASADGAEGLLPLQHAGPVLVKVHGDYRDARILNTTDELDAYDARMVALLDRIFTEYGLVFCGWSGEWDTALRNTILRTTRHRFGTYWLQRGDLGVGARGVTDLRRASVVPIDSADAAWTAIESKVAALRERRQTPSTTLESLAAEGKRLVSDARHRVRLHDMLLTEAQHLTESLKAEPQCWPEEQSAWVREANRFAALGERFGIAAATVALHTDATPITVLARSVQLVWQIDSSVREPLGRDLRLVSPATATYAIGTTLAARGDYSSIGGLLKLRIPSRQGTDGTPLHSICAMHQLLATELAQGLLPPLAPGTTYNTPWSEWAAVRTKELLQPLLLGDSAIDRAFDTFEYLWALSTLRAQARCGLGRFAYRGSDAFAESITWSNQIREGLIRDGGRHPLLTAGFATDPGELTELTHRVDRETARVRQPR